MTTYYHCDGEGCRNKVTAKDYNRDMSKRSELWSRDSKKNKDYCPDCSYHPETIECPTCEGEKAFMGFVCEGCLGTGKIPKPRGKDEKVECQLYGHEYQDGICIDF